MSRLDPDMIVLDQGLNQQTAKVLAPKGSVLDSLNYEQVDFQGQKRIDGFARYDGRRIATFDEYYVIELAEAFTGSVGSLLAVGDNVIAVVLDTDNKGGVAIAILNEKLIPAAGDTISLLDDEDGSVDSSYTVSTSTPGILWEADADVHYTNLLDYHSALRTNTEALPGPVAGLHWFRDRLYAVADVVAISLEGTTPQIFPNDGLTLGSETAKVLDAYTLQDTRLVFIDAFDTEGAWQVEGGEVTRNGSSVGTIANGFNEFSTAMEIASFFESRSEQQVIDEDEGSLDFGWRFKDLGWKVNYEDGVSLYGSLPSLNQNIQGLGIQGPTSVSGNNGKPTILTQNVDIVGKPAQVSGWKSSQTPTTYDLDIDNITSIDGDTIYADAYLSWNADNSTISSPGLTTTTLEARDASASVPVEVD